MGLYAKRAGPVPDRKKLAVVIFLALIADTTVTTGVMYVDCLVYKYSFVTYSPYIIWRYAADIIKAALYTLVLPPLIKVLRKDAP